MDSGELPYIVAPSLYHTSPPLSVSLSSSMNLKRRAQSPLEEPPDEGSRKRFKEDTRDQQNKQGLPQASWLIEAIEEELQCGCCSALVYKPVLVMPCQHFFCGRWVRPFHGKIEYVNSFQLLRPLDSCEYCVYFACPDHLLGPLQLNESRQDDLMALLQ